MGRPKKSAPAPAEIEPEEISQDIPDEEPAAVLDPEPEEDEPGAANGRAFNQAELVRKAVAAGHEKPATGVAYIKEHFDADVDSRYYSVAKAQLRKREARSSFAEPARPGRKPRAASPGPANAPAAPTPKSAPAASNGEVDLIVSLETLKPLIAAMGAEKVKRLVDLLG